MSKYRERLLATSAVVGLASALLATSAFAQSAPTSPATTEAEDGTGVEELVVTGSRIRRSEFTSPAPVQVITAEQSSLEGVINTSEILQGSSIAANARQIDSEFTGFVVAGGGGVNTASLRGLGAQRTLLLLNGKRISPAGTRGQVGAVDLNTLPSTIIERIEILKDGASSIYGSDAVAGVANIITRRAWDGIEIKAAGTVPFESGGEEYRFAASYGKTFNRGYVNASFEHFEQKSLTVGDRDYLECPQDYVFDPVTGRRTDLQYDPASSGRQGFVCFRTAGGVYTRNSDTARFVRDPNQVQNGSADPNLAINLNGYRRVNMTYTNLVPTNAAVRAGYNSTLFPTACPTTAGNADLTDPTCIAARIAYARASLAAYPQFDPRELATTARSPAKRDIVYLTGGFELTPDIEAYGEFLYARRESEQIQFGQIFNNVTTANPTNPFPFTARSTLLIPRNSDQEVNYYRGVVGLRGKLNFLDGFDWELFGVYGRSDANYGGQFTYADRVNAIINLTGTPNNINCNANLITVSDGGPNPLVRDGSQACVPVNVFRSDLVVPNAGQDLFTQAERDFLFGYEVGNTLYTQTLVEGTIAGNLFDLPAGPLAAAVGFQWREDKINDLPGYNARNNNLAGQTSAGQTVGKDAVKEVFGELQIPVIANFPLIQRFDATLSGRYTDYDSYGTNQTWKVGLNWEVNSWLRFRATDGTSYRAPALYELFLANQSAFATQSTIDPCLNTSQSTNPLIQTNCDAALRAVGVPEDRLRTFTAPGGSATVFTGGGGVGVLDPETSRAKTVGIILTPSFADLRVAVDYTDIRVDNQVSQFGAANILLTCYRSANPANEPLCGLFTRQNNPTQANYQGIATVNNSYVNIQSQRYRGIDLTVQYTHEFDWGRLRFDNQSSWSLQQERQTIGANVIDFNGEVLFPDLVGNASLRFDRGPWTATWSVDYFSKVSDSEEATAPDTVNSSARGPNSTTPGLDPSLVTRLKFINYIPFTHYHTVSLRRTYDDWQFVVGVRNIFNREPSPFSNSGYETRIGSGVLSSQYDIIGRRFFFDVVKRW